MLHRVLAESGSGRGKATLIGPSHVPVPVDRSVGEVQAIGIRRVIHGASDRHPGARSCVRNGGRSSAHFLTGKMRRSCIYRPQAALAFLAGRVTLQMAPRFMGSYHRHRISAGMLITKSRGPGELSIDSVRVRLGKAGRDAE